MKRILTSVALVTALTASSFAGVSSPGKVQASTAKTYLVAFQNKLPADYENAITSAGGKVIRTIPEIGGVEVQADNPDFPGKMKGVAGVQASNAEWIHKLDDVAEPQPADGNPVTDISQDTDNYWDYQWDIKKITNNGESYKIETGGTEAGETVKHKAVVGIIDTGIDYHHPDLQANYLGGENFVAKGGPWGTDSSETGDPTDVWDRNGHGTHVAGSIAGNGKIKGVGPDLGIRSYRIFPADDSCPTSWIAAAIVKATNDKVDVINMSIGAFEVLSHYKFDHPELDVNNVADMLVYKRAIQYAIQNGVTVVAAAGNESLNLSNPTEITKYVNEAFGYNAKGASIEVPGQIPGVITVSSSNKWSTDKIAFYSNFGTRTIDVAAPGGDNGPLYDQTGDLAQRDFHYRTLSTWPTYLAPYFTSNLNGYALLHGTSMASPKVAGIAGVIKAHYPSLSPAQVAALIEKSAVDLGKPDKDPLFGAGEANIYNALTQK